MIHVTTNSKKFDPNYENVQAKLWELTSDRQHAVIGGTFKHLKNHAQIEIAQALLTYVDEGIEVPYCDFDTDLTAYLFRRIVAQMNCLEA